MPDPVVEQVTTSPVGGAGEQPVNVSPVERLIDRFTTADASGTLNDDTRKQQFESTAEEIATEREIQLLDTWANSRLIDTDGVAYYDITAGQITIQTPLRGTSKDDQLARRNRLAAVGTYTEKHGVLLMVDHQGSQRIARFTPRLEEELEQAGYTRPPQGDYDHGFGVTRFPANTHTWEAHARSGLLMGHPDVLGQYAQQMRQERTRRVVLRENPGYGFPDRSVSANDGLTLAGELVRIHELNRVRVTVFPEQQMEDNGRIRGVDINAMDDVCVVVYGEDGKPAYALNLAVAVPRGDTIGSLLKGRDFSNRPDQFLSALQDAVDQESGAFVVSASFIAPELSETDKTVEEIMDNYY